MMTLCLSSDEQVRPARWSRLPWVLLPLGFILAHAQDVYALAAPLSVVPLALVAALNRPRSGHGVRLVVCVTVAYFVVVGALNGTFGGIAGADFVRRHGAGLYSLVIFYLFLRLASTDREIVPCFLRLGLKVVAVLSGLYLFAQFVHPFPLLGVDLARHGRMLGLLGAHNPTAAQLGVFALVGLVGLLSSSSHLIRGPGSATWVRITTVMCFVGMFSARSRGYTLGLAVAALYVLWTRRHSIPRTWTLPLRVGLVIGLMAVGASLLGSRFESSLADDPNVITRMALWERAADLGARSPLTGFGLGAFQQQDIETATAIPGVLSVRVEGEYLPELIPHDVEGGLHSHNLYLQLLSEVGLVGMALFFWPLITAWRKAKRPDAAVDGTFRALLIYLGFAGITAGLTMTSPTVAWPLFAVAAQVLTEPAPEQAPAKAATPAGP